MHLDSELATNIQFADWVCALVKRAIEYQLVEDSRYDWLPRARQLSAARQSFTFESNLHLFDRAVDDLHHSQILHSSRPIFDSISKGHLDEENMRRLERVRAAAVRDANG